eukprot:CAMPEP_0201627890 /NCGR_PEP_ID=MMETSP0493-20130528/2981_1 /ASSEMBLY_ACC=CAM_ASM_000838 /TAXON_ID=420259 /ORGANISM="Thalassiosira gravida, Strain GMp14c1" /LENGTH=364 /DNA_ID=CAMNT_0048098487 /DNA_START=15 /DNA_END=1109 /DNA_ORIENTATION=+
MSDTAAFFAKKKTKKKKFKSFNANKIDASAVTTSTHVDAPEISAENVTTSLGGLGGLGGASAGAENGSGDDQWADSSGGWGSNNKATATNTSSGDSKVAELMDMQALKVKRNEQDDVVERLRIEETKAKLARAKEGMAKEAERLVAEKEAKEFKVASRASGAAPSAAGGGGTGGKWVPSHMRSTGGASGGSRFGMAGMRGAASMDGSGFQKPVDMANEELFPDLAAADKILEEKEKQEKAAQDRMSGVRAPAGWGASRAPGGNATSAAAAPTQRKPLNLVKSVERKPLNLASAKKTEEESQPKKEDKAEETKPAAEEPAAPATTAAPAVTPAAEKAVKSAEEKPKKKVLKKKKKKDLSTFKPKS